MKIEEKIQNHLKEVVVSQKKINSLNDLEWEMRDLRKHFSKLHKKFSKVPPRYMKTFYKIDELIDSYITELVNYQKEDK
jgi:predicted nuclease with TOPRIM domain